MEKISINNLSKGNAEIFVAESENKYYWLLADFDELYLKSVNPDDLSFYTEIPKSLFLQLINLNSPEKKWDCSEIVFMPKGEDIISAFNRNINTDR